MREALIKLLADLEEIEIVGYATKVAEAIGLIDKLRPNAVILDLRLADGNGLEVLKAIRQSKFSPLVVVLTHSVYPELKQKCLDEGADFFLDKTTESEKLLHIFRDSIKNS